ncbi:glycosyltransferase family 2 protein [Nocardioides sp. MH1]|uniref:glycosyltransferase family 2 protein n=1 Tax=Nocardioides sp. MH1 TaxID=3242490 RepID=UPI00351F9B23
MPDPTDQDRSARGRISYVLPVFNEQDNIAAFHEALTGATARRGDLDFEFVYVDDGSRDASLERLLDLRASDPRVTVLSLSRNFGHQLAVTAGLDLVAEDGGSDAVIVMDTDLQDPPSVSVDMITMWEDGVDVVYGERRSRKDTLFKRSTAFAFYWALDRLASIEIPRNVGDFRLMDAKVVTEVARYREHGRFLRGIVANVGFRQEALLFDRDERHAGETGYPLRKMLSFAAHGILGFSTAPLRMISRLGIFISLLSVLLAIYVLGVRIFEPDRSVPGWAFLGVGMFLLGGIQLIMMGVMGMYVGRVYVEAQDRPLYSLALVARDGAPPTPRRHRDMGQDDPGGLS